MKGVLICVVKMNILVSPAPQMLDANGCKSGKCPKKIYPLSNNVGSIKSNPATFYLVHGLFLFI
jgi:hypothetical protein